MPKALDRFAGTALGELSRLGWFGLSADPPTLAHRSIVDAVLGSGIVQKIVVFPAGELPYKRFEASDWQRLEMMDRWMKAADFGEEVLLSRFDIQREQAMTWIELWNALQQMAPNIEHFLIVGSEQYQSVAESWNKGEELLEKANFIVIPRKGSAVNPLYPRHSVLDVEALRGSSTDVRAGDLTLVDDSVKRYIEAEGLYIDGLATSSS